MYDDFILIENSALYLVSEISEMLVDLFRRTVVYFSILRLLSDDFFPITVLINVPRNSHEWFCIEPNRMAPCSNRNRTTSLTKQFTMIC